MYKFIQSNIRKILNDIGRNGTETFRKCKTEPALPGMNCMQLRDRLLEKVITLKTGRKA